MQVKAKRRVPNKRAESVYWITPDSPKFLQPLILPTITMPVTRSQARKKASQPQVGPGISTGGAPPPLDSPVQLKRTSGSTHAATSSTPTAAPETRRTHRRLERAMSEKLLQALTDTLEEVPAPVALINSGPKPLRRYETPLNLVGNAVNNPALLNAPRASRVRRLRREPTFAAVLEELSGQDPVPARTGQPAAHKQPHQHRLLDLPQVEDLGIPADWNRKSDISYELTEQERGWMMMFDEVVPLTSNDLQSWKLMGAYMDKFREFMRSKTREPGMEPTQSMDRS
ncbi:hypothetical protein J3R30DRAFT_1597356 [Lentinula aciculospora]|uniref:Uncharacterized protein n=1 Tax=Lentinula aciculospora TaxID=153920 RepID=A0A9W9DH20_9AGAR|nr:hypothetical protein J3R30DRAFT_1597356 [Lentinula aciculospora]